MFLDGLDELDQKIVSLLIQNARAGATVDIHVVEYILPENLGYID